MVLGYFLFTKPMNNMKLYQTMGVSKDATKEEIKKAYKSLSKQYHPDTENGDEEKFKEISEAYSILMDDELRENYDLTGETKRMDFMKRFNSIIFKCLDDFATMSPVAIIENQNVFESINDMFVKGVSDGKLNIEKLKKSISKIDIFLSRFKDKKSDTNEFVQSQFERIKANFEMDINKTEIEIDFLKKCIEELPRFSYKVNEKDDIFKRLESFNHRRVNISEL